MRKPACMLLIAATLLAPAGCDDLLEDFDLDLGFYGYPDYGWSGPGGCCEETYVEEYWYGETYYEDWWYVDDTYFWPW